MPIDVDVLVVGSANLDLVATTPRLPAPGETLLGTSFAEHAGGKGLNQAVAASRSGATTAFHGALGSDAAGNELRRILGEESIDASSVALDEEPTGRALILVDDAGENSIVVVPGANNNVRPRTDRRRARVVLAQLEIPVATVEAEFSVAMADAGVVILNPAPAAPLPATLIAMCSVIVPNEHEVELLGGAHALVEQGCDAVVVTRGSAGVDIVTAAGTSHLPAFEVEVVDTTGAGDAFCGALAARLAAGDELEVASRWAAAAGALATTVKGAVPAQPRAAAISALLER